MPRKVLIVTNYDDPHSDVIIRYLERAGADVIRFNSNDVPYNMSYNLRLDANYINMSAEITSNSRVICPNEIGSVYWRRPEKVRLNGNHSSHVVRHIAMEWDVALNGMMKSIDTFWMDHPDTSYNASNKIEQLIRAKRLGFNIPKTIVTNSSQEALNFLDTNKATIYKTLSPPFLGENEDGTVDVDNAKSVKTTIVSKEILRNSSLGLSPCLFQEYVEKRYELRVTVIGNEIFAAEIHSQEREETKIDWRNYDVSIPYLPTKLPKLVEEACFEYVKSYGLNFSALDLIFTPEGKYYFIENNPSGQYLFIERAIPEFKMAEAVTNMLSSNL